MDLIENGANLIIHDPKVTEFQIKSILNESVTFSEGKWSYSKDIYIASENADAIVIVTEWDEYQHIDWNKVSKLMRKPAYVFDTRGIIDERNFIKNDLNFWKIGKGLISS